MAPLMPEIENTLKLSKRQFWMSNTISISGSIVCRLVLGPLCHKYGARRLTALVLCAASIPSALTGTVQSVTGLYIIRGFIGIAGGAFVASQYWMNEMFTQGILGTAGGIAAGWGNMGGAVTQLIMGGILLPLFTKMSGGDKETAWKTVSIIPAGFAFATGILVYNISDDTPKGNFKLSSTRNNNPARTCFRGTFRLASWILLVQYACAMGVELTMYNAGIVYYEDQFKQSPESARAITSIFGWMGIFSRGLGGYLSDEMNGRFGMRGRIWMQGIVLIIEGLTMFAFASTKSFGFSIGAMILFSVFVKMAEGTTFAIVPYVNPLARGAVIGIVGAGGPIGGVLFNVLFHYTNVKVAFYIMAACVGASSLLCPFIFIEDHTSCCGGVDLDLEDDYVPSWKQRELEQMGASEQRKDERGYSRKSEQRKEGYQ